MNKKFLIMGGIAVIFGGLSIVAADYWLKNNVKTVVEQVPVDNGKPAVEFGTIVVAGEALRYGVSIDPGMIKEIPWPKDQLPDGAFAKVGDLLDGTPRRALAAIEKNEPILVSRVTDPSDMATLSRRIDPGMRAVTIRVDDITGVAGFVVPGDRVDLALTRTFKTKEKQTGPNMGAAPIETSPAGDRTYTGDTDSFVATTIVLSNVKVLSIGQIADERQSDPLVVRAVTLEVDTQGAKAVAAAQSAGDLSLILRKAGEVAQTPLDTTVPGKIAPAMESVPVAELAPNGIDTNYTSSFDKGGNGFLSGMATVTVRRAADEETYEVRDEGKTR